MPTVRVRSCIRRLFAFRLPTVSSTSTLEQKLSDVDLRRDVKRSGHFPNGWSTSQGQRALSVNKFHRAYLGRLKFRFFPDVTFQSPSGSFRCAVHIWAHIFDTHESETETLAALSLTAPNLKRKTSHCVSRKSLMSSRSLAVRSLCLPILPLKNEFVVKNFA